MYEVEQKFQLDEPDRLADRLGELGAKTTATEQHIDTYYNHPSRDFAETREALRVRRVDGIPMVTYKGAKLPGAIKARRELEWRLDPGDSDGAKTEELLQLLGFRRVGAVRKERTAYQFPDPSSRNFADFGVVIDKVVGLGLFAEIELVVKNEADVAAARDRIAELSTQLGLCQPEPRSYLRMILELD